MSDVSHERLPVCPCLWITHAQFRMLPLQHKAEGNTQMNVIESFIADVISVERITESEQRAEIRRRIAELVGVLKINGAGREAIRSMLQDAKERAFAEIKNHAPQGIPTPTAEFYDAVFDELALRIPTTINRAKDGWFEIHVERPGELPYIVKERFASEEFATKWLEKDRAAAEIKAARKG
jgi:hypothetical protein